MPSPVSSSYLHEGYFELNEAPGEYQLRPRYAAQTITAPLGHVGNSSYGGHIGSNEGLSEYQPHFEYAAALDHVGYSSSYDLNEVLNECQPLFENAPPVGHVDYSSLYAGHGEFNEAPNEHQPLPEYVTLSMVVPDPSYVHMEHLGHGPSDVVNKSEPSPAPSTPPIAAPVGGDAPSARVCKSDIRPLQTSRCINNCTGRFEYDHNYPSLYNLHWKRSLELIFSII